VLRSKGHSEGRPLSRWGVTVFGVRETVFDQERDQEHRTLQTRPLDTLIRPVISTHWCIDNTAVAAADPSAEASLWARRDCMLVSARFVPGMLDCTQEPEPRSDVREGGWRCRWWSIPKDRNFLVVSV
jgi:hypothetical protein